MNYKHMPASKRRKFGEQGENKHERKATAAVLATFRLSGDALQDLGITPLSRASTDKANIIDLPVP